MKTSDKGIEFIAGFESLKLIAYLDVKGIPTIGIGHIKGVKMGDVITKERALILFKSDLIWVENAINRYIKVPLTQNQFDALASFTFNCGIGALEASTLRMKLNRGDYTGASEQFLAWNKARINGVLVPVAGLTRRRLAEKNMFISA